MRLWRLSIAAYARIFDGGYGLRFPGRWNSVGRPVTYAATSPSLCVLEKLVHVEDANLLPDLTMVRYDIPDEAAIARRDAGNLPTDWRTREVLTQTIGDEWLDSLAAPILLVPSVIAHFDGSPDLNALINHRHPDAARIATGAAFPFAFDARLLSP
jgi:RES domain-containing protein